MKTTNSHASRLVLPGAVLIDADNVVKFTDAPWLGELNHVRRSLGLTDWAFDEWRARHEREQWAGPVIAELTRECPDFAELIEGRVRDAESRALRLLRAQPINPAVVRLCNAFASLGITTGLVSNGDRKWTVDSGIDRAFPLFDYVVTADDMALLGLRPKPFSDAWLWVAHLAGVLPEECVVIDDRRQNLRALQQIACLIDFTPPSELGCRTSTSPGTTSACQSTLTVQTVLTAYGHHRVGAMNTSHTPSNLVLGIAQ